MFQSLFVSVKSCVVNMEYINIAEQCVILFHVPKFLINTLYMYNVNSQLQTLYYCINKHVIAVIIKT